MADDSPDADPSRPTGAAAEPRGSGPAPAWDDLKVFLAVALHGSLSGAVAATGLSLSTVTRRLRALEETLGLDLFRRGPNRLEPTTAGLRLAEAAAPMAAAAERLPALLADLAAAAEATVRVTGTHSVSLFLSDRIVVLSAAAAPAALMLVPTRRVLDVAGGEADIALRMHRPPADGDLVARRVGAFAYCLYGLKGETPKAVIAPPADPKLSGPAATIREHLGHLPVVAQIGDTPTRLHAVRSGLGAATLPCWVGDADPALARIPGVSAVPENVYLVMRPKDRRSPAVDRVARALVALFADEAGRIAGTAGGMASASPAEARA